MLNKKILNDVRNAGKKILVVTKYWDTETTQEILSQMQQEYSDIFFGLGENRIEKIIEKNLPRNVMHFIGNVQSRDIKHIIEHCSYIHSLCDLSHIQKIESYQMPLDGFVQVKLDPKKPIGVPPEELQEFLAECDGLDYLNIMGLSTMGSAEFDPESKKAEFKKLKELRNTYLPHGLISAGTSRDYDIALEERVDVVRVGQDIWQ